MCGSHVCAGESKKPIINYFFSLLCLEKIFQTDFFFFFWQWNYGLFFALIVY